MTNSTQRIALLSGASLAALGLANPAFAATVPFPPSSGYPIVAPAINDTLIISLIGDPAATYGVDNSGSGTITSMVNSDANGQITQSGTATTADAIFLATNAGVVTVRADAEAVGPGFQDASAILSTGFYQQANAAESASVTLNNTGSLTFATYANAEGDSAQANATVKSGVHQGANSDDGDATVALTNSGTLAINAIATAVASDGSASADAQIKSGISQFATADGGDASVTLTNASAGVIDLRAVANATTLDLSGGNANATATLSDGIYQYASSDTGFDATATLTNAGTIRLYADATAVADGFANADANNYRAVQQSAVAYGGGDALSTLDNSAAGVIDIRANGNALGAGASAEAYVSYGISQSANAYASSGTPTIASGNAIVGLTNAATGSISIVAQATAVGTETGATATATVSNGVYQYAYSNDGDATVGLTNAGTLSINAAALATATAGDGTTSDANARASINTGISQYAFGGGGAASVTLDNSGAVNITASAGADAATNADASATISSAINQTANAYGGDATIGLTNSSTLNIAVNANATGSSASGDASIEGGIYQSANAYQNGVDSGNAAISLTNATTGTINITSTANANASDGSADASATVSSAISQEAFAANGDASATLTNVGIINIAALANANATNADGTASSADADASVSGGVYQSAQADVGGNATTSVVNSGTINVTATADAVADGSANASASISSAISQSAYAYGGGDATTLVTNSGTLNFVADAAATGSSADASASLSYGISQSAYAYNSEGLLSGDAVVTITNASTGVININSIANAVATGGSASATASNSTAIYQNAYSAAGNATATLANSGALNVRATANGTSTGTGVLTSDNAYVYATLEGVIEQTARADGVGGVATATITNSGALTIAAQANADAADYASATATVDAAIDQYAVAQADGTATASLTNSAALSITADAVANGGTGAYASGTVDEGIYQQANVVGAGNASVSLTNAASGVITIRGSAIATATSGSAEASAYVSSAISQNADATDGVASALVTNNGTITVTADANATGTSSASAQASVNSAIYQDVVGSDGATAAIVNTGTFAVAARADAAGSTASATASVSSGIAQFANSSGGNAASTLTNSGTLTFVSHAGAVAASSYASAEANITNAISQTATSPTGDSTTSITNSSVLTIAADANATSTGDAFADAHISSAIFQNAGGNGVDGLATASIVNSGTLTISADAEAHGGTTVAGSGTAQATAYVTGISQSVGGFEGVLTLNNSGTLTVSGDAVADGADYGYASATVTGVRMDADAATNTINFTNTSAGNFVVTGNASATGNSSSTAFASVEGLNVSGGPLTLAVSNAGDFNVSANATASSANAYAYGMEFFATTDGVLDGSVSNAGTLTVAAVADGSSTSSASAIGITVAGDVNNATVTNTGTIDVLAQSNGGSVAATGVYATTTGIGTPGLADVFTFTNNGGSISARISIDGGDTFQRGMAIDVDEALGQSVINFTGAGDVYGNVDVKAGDVINVFAGETSFDGVINPECLPPIKDGVSATCGQGVLNIGAGGTLYLRDTRNTSPDTFDGPAYAFVDVFNVAATGTLAYDLPTTSTGGAQPLGSYPQIFTDVANLAGTIEVRPASENGLYDDTYFYDNVIDAVTMNGTFANCVVAGGTPLLSLQCVYDAQENLDLNIVRNDFVDIPGLTGNGIGVAVGLDCLYDPDLTGSLGALVADLFTLDTPGLLAALPQLSGGVYASYLQSFNKLGVKYNDLLDAATHCENPALAGSVLECRTNPIHVWGQIQGGTRKQDGDDFVGKTDGDQWSALIGVDAAVSPAIVLGASIGKISNRIDAEYGARVKGDGYLLGAYAVYDPGNFYAKLIGTYSSMDGDSRRDIDFRPVGGLTNGSLSGNPDVRMWTAGAHFGYRIAMGGSALTPYLNYDHVNTKLKSFVEGGLPGANLAVSGREKHDFLTAGAKYGINVGGAVLEADLGWQHMFGKRRAGVSTAFSDDLDCLFDSFSAAEKRDAIKAGLSIGGKVGGLDVRASYSGLFNGTEKNHAGSFKIVLPFGGGSR